jgi:hypothetical protein
MVFLHSHGVGTARAVRIFKTYGSDAIQVMSENPYRLARDIRGIGFKTADAIAMKLGIEKTAMIRVSYALTEAMDEGHCGLPTDELVPLAEKLLEVPQQLIRIALDLELHEGTVIADRVGEMPGLALYLWAHPQLAQDEEPGGASSEARGGGRLGQGAVAMKTEKTQTHFAFRIDAWTADGESVVEHLAGVEDYTLAMATYRAAIERWPNIPITLRQGACVIEDSRPLRLAWADKGRQGGR